MTSFSNHSKRMWTEEQCRTMVNAALLYLADQAGGRLMIPVAEMLQVCERNNGGLSMGFSDDDQVLIITGEVRQ